MVLVLLFTLLSLGIGAAGIAHSIWTGRWFLVRRIVLGLGLWVVGYGVILVSSSLASREQLLGVGEVKRFCGFYLDCHIGVALRGVRVEGSRYLVTLVVTSDARRATLTPSGLRAVLEDRAGHRYERPIAGRAVGPRGDSYVVELVFDLPAGAVAATLDVFDGGPPHRIVEAFLIGDEDSLWHARTKFRLGA